MAPEHANHVIMNSPVLSQRKLRQLLGPEMYGDDQAFIDLNKPIGLPLADALDEICAQADQAVADGKLILMLSDRYLREDLLPVHALLATGAIHHHLVRNGQRCAVNIIVETGVARDAHHIACLIGYGATAVYPYLVYQSLHDLAQRGRADRLQQLGRSYRRGIRKGLFKIMSKMGISSISSYRGAQLFEIVGLSDEIVDRCFTGTVSRIQGARFDDLHEDQKCLGGGGVETARAANPGWIAQVCAWRRVPLFQSGCCSHVAGGRAHRRFRTIPGILAPGRQPTRGDHSRPAKSNSCGRADSAR